MSREEQVRDLMRADETLMALLTGGVYCDEDLGVEGLRRGTPDRPSPVQDAFNSDGTLKPIAIVREGGISPYGGTRDQRAQIVQVGQTVGIFYYQMRGRDVIQQARDRVYQLLEGTCLQNPGSYALMWQNDSPWFPDVGPVSNSSTLTQEWLVVSNKVP